MKKIQDHYFHKAKREGYRARSVYKLQEADRKFHMLRNGHCVLDLGAAPGAWSQYAAQKVEDTGRVVSIDINGMKGLGPNVKVLQADIFEIDPTSLKAELPEGRTFDIILSDMAPRTTGNRSVDHLRSISLAETALMFAKTLLEPGRGIFYCKVFEGSDLQNFRKQCQDLFKSVKTFKPKSSRSESVEIFLFCSTRKE